MVYVNSQSAYMNMAMPDCCKTPMGPVIVPIPYPNIAMGAMATPNQEKILLTAMPAHNFSTKISMSNGDNAGVGGGLISGDEMGQSAPMMGSTKLFLAGAPAAMMGMPTMQNGSIPNAYGATISPAQVILCAMC
ncbi:DUF4150 domain-containing protein [Segnochrobactrum spirostomi]